MIETHFFVEEQYSALLEGCKTLLMVARTIQAEARCSLPKRLAPQYESFMAEDLLFTPSTLRFNERQIGLITMIDTQDEAEIPFFLPYQSEKDMRFILSENLDAPKVCWKCFDLISSPALFQMRVPVFVVNSHEHCWMCPACAYKYLKDEKHKEGFKLL
jgi:hypothetical protein